MSYSPYIVSLIDFQKIAREHGNCKYLKCIPEVNYTHCALHHEILGVSRVFDESQRPLCFHMNLVGDKSKCFLKLPPNVFNHFFYLSAADPPPKKKTIQKEEPIQSRGISHYFSDLVFLLYYFQK